MLDDLPEGLFRLLFKALRVIVELIAEGLLEVMFNRITYCAGWLAARGLTLGHRPRGQFWPADFDRLRGVWPLQLLGCAILIMLPIGLVMAFSP